MAHYDIMYFICIYYAGNLMAHYDIMCVLFAYIMHEI